MEQQKDFVLANGVKIPAVGFGSYLATVVNGSAAIRTALDVGYRYIDTARFYDNEDDIGAVLKDYGLPRAEVLLCSKVWPTMLGAEKTLESFEASCRSLGTDYLDLFLIHWPKLNQNDSGWAEKVCDSWRQLEKLYEDGRVRAIGVSNFLPHHIRPLLDCAKIKPMLDQLELHAGYMQPYALAWLKENGILAQAWSPLGRARLLTDPHVCALADHHGTSPAQILLRFLVQQGIPVIPKASSEDRLRQNLALWSFSLTEDEISLLSCLPQIGWSGEHPDLVNLGA